MKLHAVFISVFLPFLSLSADLVHMRDGEILSGKITGQNRYSVNMDISGKKSVLLKKQIRKIEYGKLLAPPEENKEPEPAGGQVPEPKGVPIVDFTADLADPKRPVRKGKKFKGPLCDAHLHLMNSFVSEEDAAGRLPGFFKKQGIIRASLMHTINSGKKDPEASGRMLASSKKGAPETVSLYCCGNFTALWLDRASRDRSKTEETGEILKRIETELDSGTYIGIGELAWRFHKKRPGQQEIQVRPDFEPFLKITDLAAKKKVWLAIHAEPGRISNPSAYQEEFFAGLALLYRRNPSLKLLLSHTGHMNSENARKVLERYPNIIMDVKMSSNHDRLGHLSPVVDESGFVYEDWAALFEEMPGRFVMGSDSMIGRESDIFGKYKRKIRYMRRLLGSLSSEAQEKISCGNYTRMFQP